VGKTVLIHHVIQNLLADGLPAGRICYLSVDHPIYTGRGLRDLLLLQFAAAGETLDQNPAYVFFDELQYLKDWETHLKSLVDEYPTIRFVGSGSAAAALKMKSRESGAGRFTDFLLPPLTFYEYLNLLGREDSLLSFTQGPDDILVGVKEIDGLNKAFVHYLNFGGYPEVVLSSTIQRNVARFVKSDIVDKVLLRDLPQLYGIRDIQELNYLFTTLAYNTASEVSPRELSQNSGVARNTILTYMEYLEAAFLIKVIHRVDRNARRFKREHAFKVYLTNPSIRSVLFTTVGTADEGIGAIVETGIYSQWFHSQSPLYYARWPKGEVDIVHLDEAQKPRWAVEVKWSDRHVRRPAELQSLASFCKANGLKNAWVTTRDSFASRLDVGGVLVECVPAALYCYLVGRNIIEDKESGADAVFRRVVGSRDG